MAPRAAPGREPAAPPGPQARIPQAEAGPVILGRSDGPPLRFRGWQVTRHRFGPPGTGTGSGEDRPQARAGTTLPGGAAEISLYRRAIGDWVLFIRIDTGDSAPVSQAISMGGIEAALAHVEALQDSLLGAPAEAGARPRTADGLARSVARHLRRQSFNTRFAALTAEVFAAWTGLAA